MYVNVKFFLINFFRASLCLLMHLNLNPSRLMDRLLHLFPIPLLFIMKPNQVFSHKENSDLFGILNF